jgi:hypothetical protein
MGTKRQQNDLVSWLARPESYPHRPPSVQHVETHISHVFLAGDLVYKLKKPVRFDFLDFSTVPAREHACREELRLNRRLAADTYLDVVPIVRAAGGRLQIRGAGEPVDWLVEMRRLPTEFTLEALHRRGELAAAHIDRLAGTLVAFYRSREPLAISPDDYRARCLAHVRGNRRELLAVRHHLPQGVVERVHGFQLQLLLLAPELFDERVRGERVVDGHGDLRPEHICLIDPVAIFDCIEFSADFRRIDVGDELAFLAAECDFLGADWVGPHLLARYAEQSGDRVRPELFDFYKSYRACVRAKVAALRADQLQADPQQTQAHEQAVREAHRHLALADRYAAAWLAPLVIAVGGLSGTGKTTLATALADALGGELLRTDTIRQELFGASRQEAAVDGGIYGPEARQQVYDELLARAANWHRQGVPVIVDGTFATVQSVRAVQHLVTHHRGRFLAVQCTCSQEVAERRIRQRLAEGRDASEARPELFAIQRARWEAWPRELPQVTIDTEEPLARQVECVLAALRRGPGNGP